MNFRSVRPVVWLFLSTNTTYFDDDRQNTAARTDLGPDTGTTRPQSISPLPVQRISPDATEYEIISVPRIPEPLSGFHAPVLFRLFILNVRLKCADIKKNDMTEPFHSPGVCSWS